MPYASNADLPEGVKNALPASAQDIWRNAYNSAERQYPGSENDGRRAQIAWGAVKNAGWKQDSEGNWKKSNADVIRTHDFDAEIFSVGKWNGDDYTEKDLDEMVKAFGTLKESVKPPVKLGHNDKQKLADGLPSLGWVTALRRVGSKLVARLSDVPDIVYKAIRAGRYKRVSSEIFWNYKDATGKVFRRVLAGVALLGADIPAVSNLQDLEAFLTQAVPSGGTAEKIAAYAFDYDTENQINLTHKMKGDIVMSDQEKKDYEAKIQAEKEAKDKAEAKVKVLEKEKEEREKKDLADKKESRVAEIKEFCEKAVKDGKMTPAYRDKVLKDMEEGKILYTHEAGFGSLLEILKSFIDQGGIMKLEKEYSVDTKDETFTDPSEEIATKAKAYMREHPKTSYDDAVTAILEANPKLARAYKNDGLE